MILVSGANGNLAGSIIRNLQSLLPDIKELAVGTRNPDSEYARQLAVDGISVRHLDFIIPETIEQALKGIHKVLFISTYEPNTVRITQHRNAVNAALKTGVSHVIYTSFINTSTDSAFEHSSQVHAPTEKMIIDSGLSYTFLRHNLYSEFLVLDLKDTLATGKLMRGGGNAGISFIGRDDLGVSAATVLSQDGHENRIYTETGPEVVTYTQAARIMSEIFERPIEFVDLTPEQWYERSRGMGFEESLARASASNVRAAINGEFSIVSNDYETITGHPARSIHRYLNDNKEKYMPLSG